MFDVSSAVIILSLKPYKEIRCGRGCNCYHGSSASRWEFAVFDSTFKAAEHIAKLNDTLEKGDGEFTHRIIFPDQFEALGNQGHDLEYFYEEDSRADEVKAMASEALLDIRQKAADHERRRLQETLAEKERKEGEELEKQRQAYLKLKEKFGNE